MRPVFRTLAILLPLAGLAYSWQSTRQSAAQGVEWDVPVNGYDPRDPLRGHYVRFTYVWPEDHVAPDIQMPADQPGGDWAATWLCIEGEAPVIRRATRMMAQDSTKGCQGRASTPDIGFAPQSGIRRRMVPTQGRLYVPQAEAPQLERALTDPKQHAILRFRLKPDGEIVPLHLSFQPSPITH